MVKQSSFQHSGFVGDKIGYRPVLIFNLLLVGAAATSFTFISVYKEYTKVPHAILYKASKVTEEPAVPYALLSIVWSLCDEEVTESEGSCGQLKQFLKCLNYVSTPSVKTISRKFLPKLEQTTTLK